MRLVLKIKVTQIKQNKWNAIMEKTPLTNIKETNLK